MRNLIIEHPEWQTPKQKYVIGFVTLGFWMVWFYLWIPFISLMAWMFGIHVFEQHMIELGGYRGALDLLGVYAIVISLLGGSLIIWATYNIRRFAGMERRNPMAAVSVEMQAKYFHVAENALAGWQKSQRIMIEHGHIHALQG